MTTRLQAAVAHDNAISAVYRVLERHPKFALAQMNDHIANEIVIAVKASLSGDAPEPDRWPGV